MVRKLTHVIYFLLSKRIGFDKNVIFGTDLKKVMKKIFEASYF